MQQSVVGCNVAVLGSKQASVTVNSSSAGGTPKSRPFVGSTLHRPGQVIITPLSTVRRLATPTGAASSLKQPRQVLLASASRPEANAGMFGKVLLKAVGNIDPKTFTLRNVDTVYVNSEEKLKLLIRTQLQKDILSGEFDIGYLQGSTVVNIRNSQDLVEIWNNVRKGNKTILWCDNFRSSKFRSCTRMT